jgi:aminoglycoside phosphotransferase family enzyme
MRWPAGSPRLFDCIGFNEELANTDVLYDLAFLLMDIEFRRLAGLANGTLNR